MSLCRCGAVRSSLLVPKGLAVSRVIRKPTWRRSPGMQAEIAANQVSNRVCRVTGHDGRWRDYQDKVRLPDPARIQLLQQWREMGAGEDAELAVAAPVPPALRWVARARSLGALVVP